MIVVLQRPTRAARYIATCRLKHAGCELPSPRVGPSRAETIAAISARDMRRTGIDEGANDWDAIYALLAVRAAAGRMSKLWPSVEILAGHSGHMLLTTRSHYVNFSLNFRGL